jgi:hypothetical protein
METLDSLVARLQDMRAGTTSVLDVVMQMNESNQLDSGLDLRTWVLVRLAALAASDAPPESFAALLSVAEGEDVSRADLFGTLVAAAPAVGAARTLSAALRLADALP